MSESGTWVGEEVERRFWPKFLGKPGEGGSVPRLDCEMCDLRQGGSGLRARPQSQTPLPDGPPASLVGGVPSSACISQLSAAGPSDRERDRESWDWGASVFRERTNGF